MFNLNVGHDAVMTTLSLLRYVTDVGYDTCPHVAFYKAVLKHHSRETDDFGIIFFPNLLTYVYVSKYSI